MEEGSSYDHSEGAIANYDQLKAHALHQIKESDSFVAIVGFVDNETKSGMRIMVVSATKTPFAPYFLAEATNAAASIVIQSIEGLAEDADTEA